MSIFKNVYVDILSVSDEIEEHIKKTSVIPSGNKTYQLIVRMTYKTALLSCGHKQTMVSLNQIKKNRAGQSVCAVCTNDLFYKNIQKAG